MSRWLIIVISVFSFSFTAAANTHVHILTYKVWKHKKIDEALSVVNELNRELKKMSNVKDDGALEDRADLNHQKTQAELNLGVAKELSANDYFVLYVAPQFKDNVEALGQAAKNLSPKDVADILSAYQKRLQAGEAYGAKTNTGDVSPSMAIEPPLVPGVPSSDSPSTL